MKKKVYLAMFLLLGNCFYMGHIRANCFADKNNVDEVLVHVVFSNWPPFIYKEEGEYKGFSYEIFKDVFARAGVPFSMQIGPWARIYKMGLNNKNCMIIGVGRTKKRESLFNWIGPVAKGEDNFFYKLKGEPIEIKNHNVISKYTVATIRGTYMHDFLVDNGFSNIEIVTKYNQMFNMLLAKRIDLFIASETVILEIDDNDELNPGLFEKAYFAFTVTDYMALSKNTSPELVEKLRNAYQELEQEGKIILH